MNALDSAQLPHFIEKLTHGVPRTLSVSKLVYVRFNHAYACMRSLAISYTSMGKGGLTASCTVCLAHVIEVDSLIYTPQGSLSLVPRC